MLAVTAAAPPGDLRAAAGVSFNAEADALGGKTGSQKILNRLVTWRSHAPNALPQHGGAEPLHSVHRVTDCVVAIAVRYSAPVLVGLGHPRCGTAFTAELLKHHGLDVPHERVGADGIVSWMQVAKRSAVPWGETLTEYPTGSKVFVIARSPVAALNSVAIENQQIRSIGFRSQVIWDRRRIDLFCCQSQTGFYDFFGWAAISLAYWYDFCLEDSSGIVFRVDRPEDDAVLSEFVGRPISRIGKDIWQNPGKDRWIKQLDAKIDEMGGVATVPKVHLAKLVDVTRRLGYPEDAEFFSRYL